MKKIISVLLAVCLLLPLTVLAAGVGTANRIAFSQTGTRTETVDPGTDRGAYIAEKKVAFRSMLDRYASLENLTTENWESLFTQDAYAQWEGLYFDRAFLDMSDDAIVIGDEDDWENMYVVSGTVNRTTCWKAEYTLVTLKTAGPVQTVDRVTLTVAPPPAGSSTNAVAPAVTVTGKGVALADSRWLLSPTMYTSNDPEFAFEEGETYYIYLMIRAEEGYAFPKDGAPTTGIDEGFILFSGCEATGGEVIFAASRVMNDGSDYLRVKVAVVSAAGAAPGIMKGDVDGNGKVDSTDARLTLQLAVDKIKESALKVPAAADVDGSGKVDSTDARLILQYAVDKIKAFPAA